MNENFDIKSRPQLQTTQPTARLDVAARRQNWAAPIDAPSADLDGLIKGLSSFNPALNQLGANAMNARDEELKKAVQPGDDLALANAAAVQSPRDAITGQPIEVPSTIPPALGDRYRRQFGTALAARAAVDIKSDVIDRYTQQKGIEGFDADKFLAGERQKALAGVTDTHMRGVIGNQFLEVEANVKGEAQRLRTAQLEDTRNTTMVKLADDKFTADMGPKQLADTFHDWYMPQANGMQIDKKQAVGFFMQRLDAMSAKAGGSPELYDALSIPGPDGITPLQRDPRLNAAVIEHRQHATQMRERAQREAMQPALSKELMDLDGDIASGSANVTQDRLSTMVTEKKVSAEKAANLWQEAQKVKHALAATAAMGADADIGKLGFYDPKDQNAILDRRLLPAISQMWNAAVKQGDPAQRSAVVAQYAGYIANSYSMTGATVPLDSMKRMFDTNITNLPNAAGPTPGFTGAAEIYKAWSADPAFRGKYFEGDTEKLMEAYTTAVDGGVDPKTAYTDAYRSISPEAKASAEKRAKSPEMQTKIGSIAVKYVQGSSWVPTWIGGNGRPSNAEYLGAWASGEARKIMAVNPDLNEAQVQAHVEKESQKNFVLDETSQVAVKIPPAFAGAQTQAAITGFSDAMLKKLKDTNRLPDGTILRYVPSGDEGQYSLETWNGTARESLGTVNIRDIVNLDRKSKMLDPKVEMPALAAYQRAVQDGTPLPDIDPALLGKARSLGFFDSGTLRRIDDAGRNQFLTRLKEVPTMAFGKPTGDNTTVNRAAGKVDHQLTAQTALSFVDPANLVPGSEQQGLAMSLITQREGVVLSAYADPAAGAGKNIGMGYNLDANAATVDADLKRAGVPDDMVSGIKDGTKALLPEQAKRLLQVAYPRYEKQAKATADATAPGLWEKMLPSQRAVMVDIAWQVGDPAKFTRAWKALASGDTANFANEVKVFYTNQDGQKVEDKRANDLRASMLEGAVAWKQRVSLGGQRPSNSLQAAAS